MGSYQFGYEFDFLRVFGLNFLEEIYFGNKGERQERVDVSVFLFIFSFFGIWFGSFTFSSVKSRQQLINKYSLVVLVVLEGL